MTGRFIFICCKPYMSKGQQRYKIVLFSPENNDIEQCFCNFSYEGSMGDVVLVSVLRPSGLKCNVDFT